MAIPVFSAFLRPVLELVAEYGTVESPRRSLLAPLAKKMSLTEAEVAERLPSGGLRLNSRCGWALTYLSKAGLVEFPRRGITKITDSGLSFLARHQGPIDISDLDQFPSFLDFQRSNEIQSDTEARQEHNATDGNRHDPEQLIELAIGEIRSTLIAEILMILSSVDPTYFEIIILDLMGAMGYGGKSARMEHTGRSGDFGIDGIVHLDRLGFEKIYIQAKRWKAPVGRPEVQAFFGTLAGKKARKGVMITTSYFTPDAKTFSETVSDSLMLVDGQLLAGLMIDHGVGVTNKKAFAIPFLDRDYFEQ